MHLVEEMVLHCSTSVFLPAKGIFALICGILRLTAEGEIAGVFSLITVCHGVTLIATTARS